MDQNRPPVETNGLENILSKIPAERRRECARTWELLGDAQTDLEDAPSLEEAWADLQSRVRRSRDRAPFPRKSSRIPGRLRGRFAIGATLVLACVVVGLWWWQRPVAVSARQGEFLSVRLPDGSTVELNSGTRLEYQRGFQSWPFIEAKQRMVTLRGEAFFDVESNGRPFVIQIPNARVEVLGTRFNVRAWGMPHDYDSEVTLEEGRVRVSVYNHPKTAHVLSLPGEMARVGPSVADTTVVVERRSLDHALAWRRHAFAAVDRTVGSILSEIERRYALTVDIEGELALNRSMTLIYGAQTGPENILHDICLVQGCRYRRTSHGYEVFYASPDSRPE